MIRVAFDIAQTAAERAGCAWYAEGLAKALARRTEVELHTYAQFGEWLNDRPGDASTVEGTTRMLADMAPEKARGFWLAAATAGLPGRPAIVHSNSYQAPVVHGALLVFTIHDLSFWTRPHFASEATRQVCQMGVLDALGRAAGLAFVSESSRAEFETMLPGWLARSGRPSAVIPGASRFPPQATMETPTQNAPWLSVGSIEPRKNLGTLLDAYEIYRQNVSSPRPLHLIGGHGWQSEDIHMRVSTLEESGFVRYLGYVTDEQLASNYRRAFALLQGSWHEGFGLPLVEAFGYHLPVLCSDIPSFREVAHDAATYISPASAQELAHAMIGLHNRPDLYARSRALVAHRATYFSWDRSASLALEFYRSLLAHLQSP